MDMDNYVLLWLEFEFGNTSSLGKANLYLYKESNSMGPTPNQSASLDQLVASYNCHGSYGEPNLNPICCICKFG